MKFPYTFFEDEVREGFYISGAVKRAWAAQMEILSEVAKVCEKHNIKWYADCGTLLGAVRHGGYIPWDDDLDICMLRDDYVKFNQVAKDELPDYYEVINMHNEEDFFEYITRVTSGHRLNFDEEYVEKYHECPFATGIDVFPLDYLCPDEEKEEQRRQLADLLMKASDSIDDRNLKKSEIRNTLREIENLCGTKIDPTKSVRKQLYEMTEAVFTMYSSKNAKHVALMHYWVPKHNHKYNIKHFSKRVNIPFECMEIPVPYAYDEVLKVEYGNYMTVNKGGGMHGYPYFEGQEEHLMGLVEDYPFKYKFDKAHLENDERNNFDKPRKQAKDFVELMGKAHEALVVMLSVNNYEQAVNMLASCQNGAINIGTLLEERYGEGIPTVKVLEEYCEILFQIGQLIEEAVNSGEMKLSATDVLSYLQEITVAIDNSIENDIPNKYEVMFIPVKADAWKNLDAVWRVMKDNPDYEVKVMPIPYYERDAKGKMKDMHYEGGEFPDYLEIVNYEEYDLVKNHPDEIIIQNAYDTCNYTTTIMPQYYAGNIKAHTKKLTYIPWFKVDDITEKDEKARKVMQYYCSVPGLAHADSVIVQSEAMRKEYIKYLTEFAGEDTRKIWEDKISVSEIDIYGANSDELIAYEKEKAFLNIPEAWKNNIFKDTSGKKKVMIYNTTVAAYAAAPEAFVNKVKNNIKTFEEYKDSLFIIWRCNSKLKEIMRMENKKLTQDFEEILSSFETSGVGAIDQDLAYEELMNVSDAYYGDNDCLAHLCQLKGLPVMIQYVEK